MSSYIIVDVDALADLLVEMWAQNSRHRSGQTQEKDTEFLRREKERLDAAEREAQAFERQLELQYQEAMAILGAADGAEAAQDQARQTERLRYKLQELQSLAQSIARETETLGADFLADFSNYRETPALYREVAQRKTDIQAAAAEIVRQGGRLTEYDAEGRFRAVEKLTQALEDSYDQLMGLFARSAPLRDEAKDKRQRFSALLGQLANGTQAAVAEVQILPQTLPGAAAEAQAVRYAVDTVRHYLLGPESALLSKEQRQELRQLYDVPYEQPLAAIASRSGRDLRSLNEQFRAAKKRSFDRAISENRRACQEARDRYFTMYETVHGTLDGVRDTAADAGGSPQTELQLLEDEIGRLERRYYQILRQRLLEDTMKRALVRSRAGVQARQLGAADTMSGNRRALYQIGSDGTAIEVYTDARGQVLIEAGGIVDGPGPASAAQSATIGRNLTYFCDHQLPAILDAFQEELAAAELTGEICLRKEPEEDRLHLFTLDAYPEAQDALIIEQDGTVRRSRDSGPAPARALEEE